MVAGAMMVGVFPVKGPFSFTRLAWASACTHAIIFFHRRVVGQQFVLCTYYALRYAF